MHDDEQLIKITLPAAYQAALEAMLRRLAEEQVVQRLWRCDPSLWHPAASTQLRIARQLGWLGLPMAIPQAEATLHSWRSTIIEQQITDVLYVALGMLGRAAHLWQDCFEPVIREPRVHLFDSTDPLTVQQQLATLEPRRTRVVLASPPDTPQAEALSRIVATMGEVEHLPLPADVGARFAALSAPSLGLAALLGLDFRRLHGRALLMNQACQRPDLAANPGVLLGASLGVLAQQGHDILLLIASPSLAPLAAWIEALLAGALSKHQRGFVPIRVSSALDDRDDLLGLYLRFEQQQESATTEQVTLLEQRGIPILDLSLAESYDLAAQIVLWQVAVAVAAIVIGLNPFDAPDTDVLNARIRQTLARSAQLSTPATSLTQDVIYDAMPVFRQARFVAIVGYLPLSLDAQVQKLRLVITRGLGIPVTVVYPARDAAFSLQLLHAGRPGGVVLALSALPVADVSVPRATQSLIDLQRAHLEVEEEAWKRMERPYVQIDLGAEPGAELQRLCERLGKRLLS